MTTLEMLNASAKEPEVKFMVLADSHAGFYYRNGRFCNPKGYDIGPSVTWFMEQTWEREKPEPLRGEIECEVMFNSCGDYACDLARRVRETFGDTVKDKRFRFKGAVEEIV